MTILDSFFLLFESDASKLDKGLSETEKKAKGLQEKLKATDDQAGKMGASLTAAVGALAGLAAATLGLAAFGHELAEATELADHLDETAERLNTTTDVLSNWGDVVKISGGSVDGFAASMEGLNTQLAQLDVTGKSRAAPFLAELGIDLDNVANKGKSAMDFLPDLAESFSKLDSTKAIALGRRLGLDQGTIMALHQGRDAVNELLEKQRELGVVTAKQGEIAGHFNDTLDDTRHAFRTIYMSVLEYVLPPLTWMAEKMQGVAIFMRKHSDFIIGLMIAIGGAVSLYALPPLFAMATAAIVAYAPFFLLGAIVTALAVAFALLYDDVMNFVDGGGSLIGRFVTWIQSFTFLNNLVGFLGAGFRYLWAVIGQGLEITGAFLSKLTPVQVAFRVLKVLVEGARESLSLLWEVLKGIGSSLGNVLSAAGKLVGKGIDATSQALATGRDMLNAAASNPIGSQSSASILTRGGNSKTTSVQVGKVEVHTQATDAAGISKSIGDTMGTQLRHAAANFDDGVLG